MTNKDSSTEQVVAKTPALDAALARTSIIQYDAETGNLVLLGDSQKPELTAGPVLPEQLADYLGAAFAEQVLAAQPKAGWSHWLDDVQDLNPQVKVKRTVLQFTVLHPADVDVSSMDLTAIAEQCDSGDMVGGGLKVQASHQLGRLQLDDAAAELGSEAEFFGEEDDLLVEEAVAPQQRGR